MQILRKFLVGHHSRKRKKCRMKCYSKFSDAEQSMILEQFNKVGTYDAQRLYSSSLMSITDINALVHKRRKACNRSTDQNIETACNKVLY